MMEQWLKCIVFKGMFSDELAIRVSLKRGRWTSCFVPKDKVDGRIGEEGKVKVEVFKRGGTTWAVLPTEYSEAYPVNEADLVAS